MNHYQAIAASGGGWWLPTRATSATLIGWYEVRSDLLTLDTGDASQLNNRIAGGANPLVQSSAGARPTLENSAWGSGRESLLFDGATDEMNANGLAATVSGTDVAFSIIMVAQIVTLGSVVGVNRALWGFGRSTGGDISLHDLRLPDSTTNVMGTVRRDDANTAKVKNAAVTLNTSRNTYSYVFTGTRAKLRVGGVLDGNLDGGATSSSDVDVGAITLDRFSVGALTRSGTSGQTHLRLGGMLVYQGALSDSETLLAERYLKTMHPL